MEGGVGDRGSRLLLHCVLGGVLGLRSSLSGRCLGPPVPCLLWEAAERGLREKEGSRVNGVRLEVDQGRQAERRGHEEGTNALSSKSCKNCPRREGKQREASMTTTTPGEGRCGCCSAGTVGVPMLFLGR